MELLDTDWFHEPIAVETRQCLALRAGAALAGPDESRGVAAVRLRLEMLKEAVNAFGHLGDAPPYVSEAEAFIRRNAHDAYYPHHEKDYRLLALFAPQFMRGAQLLVLRLSQSGRLEGDVVRGQGATTRYGTVLIHRGHMRHVQVPAAAHQELLQALEASGRLVREVQADGWPTYLDSMESLGEFLSSKPFPCIRCHRPQTQYKVGLPFSEAPWDPALSPVLPDSVPLKDRPQFAKGIYVQEVFAGWGGWTSGMLRQGFRADPPIEYYEVPLQLVGPRPEHDIQDAAVRAALLEKARAPPDADVPNLWEWETPCTTYCDYQRLNGGTRTSLRPEGDGSRADEVQGNEFAKFASELCLELRSSALMGQYPKIWDLPCVRRLREQTGARIVPMHMCVWFLQPHTCQPHQFHKKATWWLVSAELFPWVHLFLARRCPGVTAHHTHVPLGGPSHLPGVPATRVAQQFTVPLCAAWGLAVRGF